MNDNDVIKALQNCLNHYTGCGDCPLRVEGCFCRNALLKQTLDLINRLQADKEALINGQETLQKYIAEQKAENERLQKYYEMNQFTLACATGMPKTLASIKKMYATAKSEARKEFAERLCEGRVSNDPVVIAVKVELEMMDGKKEGEK